MEDTQTLTRMRVLVGWVIFVFSLVLVAAPAGGADNILHIGATVWLSDTFAKLGVETKASYEIWKDLRFWPKAAGGASTLPSQEVLDNLKGDAKGLIVAAQHVSGAPRKDPDL